MVEEALGKRIAGHGLGVPHDPGHEPGHGLDDHHRREFAARQHVVADAHLLGFQHLDNPFVHALVPAAHDDQVGTDGQGAGPSLSKALALRGGEDHRRGFGVAPGGPGRPNRLDGPDERLRRHDHPRPAAVGDVVDGAVAVRRKLAEVPHREVDEPALPGAAEGPHAERPGKHPRKDRDDVDPHRNHSGRRATSSPAAGSIFSTQLSTAGRKISGPSGGRTT